MRIHYDDMQFVFVTNYYDLPLEGTCLYENKLCQFQIEPTTDDGDETGYYTVVRLSMWGKIKAKLKQTAFEWCVGYHWTYKDNCRSSAFYYRRPQWLFKLLFSLYYWVTMRQWIRLGK